MEFVNSLGQGFTIIATWQVAAAMLAGAMIGIVVGVLPGVGPGVTIAVMLPFTYGMTPMAGISLLLDRKSTRLNSSHVSQSRMPSSA